ncbi:MAG: hypothetical protein ACRDWD_17485, partial [Acidimicrobiia bacterium]
MTNLASTPASGNALLDDRPSSWRSTFWVGVSVLLGVTAVLVSLSVLRNDGHLVYALDDAAIHMSMIRNLAEHGTWGVVPHEYVSASSSPGWELLMVGPVWLVPRLLNVLPLVVN